MSRTKCDGDGRKPCTACSNGQKECTFSITSHRVSEDSRIKERDSTHHESTPTEDGAGQQSLTDESLDFSAVIQSSDMVRPLENLDKEESQTVLDPASLSPMQMTAWPWLHEDLFFQHDVANDWLQPLMEEVRNSEDAVQPMLLDGTSDEGFGISSGSAAEALSRGLIRHPVWGNTPQQLSENATIQATAQQNPTFLANKNQISNHSEFPVPKTFLVLAA